MEKQTGVPRPIWSSVSGVEEMWALADWRRGMSDCGSEFAWEKIVGREGERMPYSVSLATGEGDSGVGVSICWREILPSNASWLLSPNNNPQTIGSRGQEASGISSMDDHIVRSGTPCE